MANDDNSIVEHGKASIVLLIGTSSAGKGTIIKEMKRQDEGRPPEEQLEWQEDGFDMGYHRHPVPPLLPSSLLKTHIGIVSSNPDSKSLLDELNKVLTKQHESLAVINSGELKVSGHTLSLLGEEVDIDQFRLKLSPEERDKYTKQSFTH